MTCVCVGGGGGKKKQKIDSFERKSSFLFFFASETSHNFSDKRGTRGRIYARVALICTCRIFFVFLYSHPLERCHLIKK